MDCSTVHFLLALNPFSGFCLKECSLIGTCFSRCKRFWPSKVVLAIVSIYGHSTRDFLILFFFALDFGRKLDWKSLSLS